MVPLGEQIRSVLSSFPQVRLGLLFGSQARQEARKESDVDVAIDAGEVDISEVAARLSEVSGREVDVVLLSQASIPLLERLIAESIVVHESRLGAGAAWRSRVLVQLETDLPWYRRMRDAWLQRVAVDGLKP